MKADDAEALRAANEKLLALPKKEPQLVDVDSDQRLGGAEDRYSTRPTACGRSAR